MGDSSVHYSGALHWPHFLWKEASASSYRDYQMNNEFEQNGYLLHRRLIDSDTVSAWAALYASLADPNRVPEFNPVAINDDRMQPLLSLITRHPAILDAVEEVFGPNIALYNQRFVVKDAKSRDAVFLHQDTPYHIGWPRKLSAFVALSESKMENGGLYLRRATHIWGYLGDAGELNPEVLGPNQWLNAIDMHPGDVLLMHSACWHGSYAHTEGPDRVLTDIIYQPADDPSGKKLMRGTWKTNDHIQDEQRANMFIRSRTSRLKELQEQLDKQ